EPAVGAPAIAQARTAIPGSAATAGSRPRSTEVSPYAIAQNRERGGRLDGHRNAALPARAAGEPAHRCSAGTTPRTVDPGAISAPLPIRAPGNSVLRAPTRAPAPIRILPMWTTSPSTQ